MLNLAPVFRGIGAVRKPRNQIRARTWRLQDARCRC